MEPYKFEQDIKNKLEKRSIQPLNNSWQKLSDSLEKKEHKKNNKFLWIMGVAASIVGILFVVSVFFKEDSDINSPIIVASPEFGKEDTLTKVAVEEVILKTEDSTKKEVLNSLNNDSNSVAKKTIYNANSKNKKSESIAVLVSTKNNTSEELAVVNKNVNDTNLMLESQKIDSIFSQIQNLKDQNKTVLSTDIDALLFNAQQELALQKIIDESKKTVDAYKLLQDVEAELDKSMRVKFLETLKLNYENMKTLIAQRND